MSPTYTKEPGTFLGTKSPEYVGEKSCDLYYVDQRILLRWGNGYDDCASVHLEEIVEGSVADPFDFVPKWLVKEGYLKPRIELPNDSNVKVYCAECDRRVLRHLSDREKQTVTVDDLENFICADCM